ncbi:hypothetical protein CYMTET_4939 [Cymbomonas tetramitiformis]|uniref:Uncharacterized protein n=1 Tax=Cymbomonas tetramitiformis TaxID=36881 RepID=A0AAE0H0E9_9CHLO|nr:hypothetical protein CYMTET_4939 [Cymbomonas tetramitiformis]
MAISVGEVQATDLSLPAASTSAEASSGPAFSKTVGSVLQFQPHGQTFTIPVTIEIPYVASQIQSGDKACMLKAASATSTTWTEYCDGVSFANGIMTTTISSFSIITIGVTDLTAPTLGPVVLSSFPRRGTALEVALTADEVCSVYYVVLEGGSTAPSSTQVIAGTAADDTGVMQTDPRAAPLVKGAGVLNYDSDTSASLTFTIHDLEDGRTYDVYAVGQDAAGNAGGSPVLRTKDTADTLAPVITLFEGHAYKKYKRGAAIGADYVTAYDAYDGDLSSSIIYTGDLDMTKDVSSVKITARDAAGNSAISYATCNCLTCYPKGTAAGSLDNVQSLMHIDDTTEHSPAGPGYIEMEQEDGRVVVVNSREADVALKQYQKRQQHDSCYCKCKQSNGRHHGL